MDGNDNLKQYSRIPTIEDLVELCRNLNAHQIKYVTFLTHKNQIRPSPQGYTRPYFSSTVDRSRQRQF